MVYLTTKKLPGEWDVQPYKTFPAGTWTSVLIKAQRLSRLYKTEVRLAEGNCVSPYSLSGSYIWKYRGDEILLHYDKLAVSVKSPDLRAEMLTIINNPDTTPEVKKHAHILLGQYNAAAGRRMQQELINFINEYTKYY